MLRRSTYLQNLENENAKQAADAEAAVRFDEIIGSTPRMREIFATVSLVAKTDVTVLVQGESGTGKELVARAVHQKSRRRHAPFRPCSTKGFRPPRKPRRIRASHEVHLRSRRVRR